MHVWHALSRRLTVLHRDVESIRFVNSLEGALDACYGEEEVGDFVLGEVGEAGFDAEGRDEDMAREEGFEVYEREGVGCGVEDLPRCLSGVVEIWEIEMEGECTWDVTLKEPNMIVRPGKGGISLGAWPLICSGL